MKMKITDVLDGIRAANGCFWMLPGEKKHRKIEVFNGCGFQVF